MNNKFLWGSLIVVVIILISTYEFNKSKPETLNNDRQEAIENEIQRPSVTVNVKHQYKEGRHIMVGLVELPTSCDTLSTKVERKDMETILDINYTSISENCAQVITEKYFRISFEGNMDDNIIARLNGEVINLNIFEIDPSKDIDEVEIFNKG